MTPDSARALSVVAKPSISVCNTDREESPFEAVAEILPTISDWAALAIREKAIAQCRHPIAVHGLKVDDAILFAPRDHDVSLALMNQLMSDNKPFVLSFDDCLLKGCKGDGHPNHSAVVTGRRWNPDSNTCELQIRSSWGKNSCPKRANEKDSTVCQDGVWWLSEEAIAKSSVTEITYLEPAK
jgi:hypothetical protein